DVVVTNPDGQSTTLANGFTYGSPTLSSIDPNSGSTTGNTSVTLTGTNFNGGATVSFGGTPATGVTVVSNTSIIVTTPAHASGVVDIVLTNLDGQSATLAGGFTYYAPTSLSSVTPSSGSTLGNTSVTLSGTNFRTGATVSFG